MTFHLSFPKHGKSLTVSVTQDLPLSVSADMALGSERLVLSVCRAGDSGSSALVFTTASPSSVPKIPP